MSNLGLWQSAGDPSPVSHPEASEATRGFTEGSERVLEMLSLRDAGRDFSVAECRELVEQQLPAAVRKILDDARWVVRGSAGMGSPAEVPWVGVFPAGSPSAQRGIYLVFLFAADGSRLYLSLAQGGGNGQGNLAVLQKRSDDLRRLLGERAGLLTAIDLASQVQRPRTYEAGCVYAVEYLRRELPQDDRVPRDLHILLSLLEEIAPAAEAFPEEEPLHVLMKWNSEVRPSTIQDHKQIADEHGTVWWGKLGRSASTAISAVRLAALREQIDRGVPTHCYLYRSGALWRTRLLGVTADATETDPGRFPNYYTPADCNLFLLLSDFEQLDDQWAAENLLLASKPDPAAVTGTLGNQTNPLLVFERLQPVSESSEDSDDPLRLRPSPKPELDLTWLAAETLWEVDQLEELLESLHDRPQIILAGPPGTGKTWVAKQVARYLTADVPLQYRVLQFHPTYGYEDFIEGLRPVPRGDSLVFERVDGAVLRMVQQIGERHDRPHLLILDEMNRANLPRVFGELMYSLEYRDEPVDLLHTQDFTLPNNLIFAGTMNTADRSTRSLDVALRRRFPVFECFPDAGILERYYRTRTSDVPDLIAGFERLNARLAEELDRHHGIGHTFFMARHYTQKQLAATWSRQILPLLEEYFFDDPTRAGAFQLAEFWPSQL